MPRPCPRYWWRIAKRPSCRSVIDASLPTAFQSGDEGSADLVIGIVHPDVADRTASNDQKEVRT
jgi:hypothetical protein